MRNQLLREKRFERRSILVAGGKMLLLSTLAGRLYYLQIMKADRYKTMADGNRIRLRPVLPERGKLLDRFGMPLAENTSHYRVIFESGETDDSEAILQQLIPVLDLKEERLEVIREKIKNATAEPIILKKKLEWDEVAAIEVASSDLPGVDIELAQVRQYPYAEEMTHVLGYVAAPKEEEVKKSTLLRHADFKIGRTGMERVLEKELRGKVGVKRTEVNAYGLNVRELSIEESVPGTDVKLTLNGELQEYVGKRIKGQGGIKDGSGAAVVIDIETGGVLALASAPGYDTSAFAQGITEDYWDELRENPDKPLINKAVSTQYPPGSTFKIITALAALKKGVIGPNTRIYCPGYMVHGNRKFHCWQEHGHGYMSLKDAIAQSCNVYFYKVSQKVGVDNIAAMARKFGLGSPLHIELPGEKSGLVPTKEWKRKLYGRGWLTGETINTAIGQGYVLATPLQLAVMTARIASGKQILPHLIKREEVQDSFLDEISPDSHFADLDVSKQHLKYVLRGMERVANNPRGTAYYSRIPDKDMAMAGKTGTSQVRGKPEDKDEFIPRKYRNHALFVGYAPVNNPRYAVAVVVEHGGSGSLSAAPVGRDILHEAQLLENERKERRKEALAKKKQEEEQ